MRWWEWLRASLLGGGTINTVIVRVYKIAVKDGMKLCTMYCASSVKIEVLAESTGREWYKAVE